MQHFYKYIKQYAFYKGYKVSIEVIIITQIISSFEQFFLANITLHIYIFRCSTDSKLKNIKSNNSKKKY